MISLAELSKSGWMENEKPTNTSDKVTVELAASPAQGSQPPQNNGAGNPPSASLLPRISKASPFVTIIILGAIAAAAVWASSEL